MNRLKKIADQLRNPVINSSIKVLILRASGAGLQILVLFTITNFAEETLVGQYNYFNYTIILFSAIVLLGMNTSFLQFSGKLEAEGDLNKMINLYSRCLRLLIISFTSVFLLYWISRTLLN